MHGSSGGPVFGHARAIVRIEDGAPEYVHGGHGESLRSSRSATARRRRPEGRYRPGGNNLSIGQRLRISGLAGKAVTASVGGKRKSKKTSTKASGGTKWHRVRSGDTLGRIAAKYDTNIAAVKRLNGIKGDRIKVGQRIKVGSGGVATAEPMSKGRIATHTVRKGDVVGTIARKYGMSVADLVLAEQLKKDRIYSATMVRIKQRSGVETASASAPAKKTRTYVVRARLLSVIADRYGVHEAAQGVERP